MGKEYVHIISKETLKKAIIAVAENIIKRVDDFVADTEDLCEMQIYANLKPNGLAKINVLKQYNAVLENKEEK